MADETKTKIENKESMAEKINENLKKHHESLKQEIGNKQMKMQGAPIKEKQAETKVEEKKEMKKEEKQEPKKEEKKEVKVVKKEEAITKGNNLHASMRQCMYICRFIKNKSIDDAIKDLEDVILYKKIVPFKGEIPHRKGKMMSGRYPINASKLFIPILKTLKGNVLANKMELDKTRIYFASACYASRPSKKGGGRFKRANLVLKAKEVVK